MQTWRAFGCVSEQVCFGLSLAAHWPVVATSLTPSLFCCPKCQACCRIVDTLLPVVMGTWYALGNAASAWSNLGTDGMVEHSVLLAGFQAILAHLLPPSWKKGTEDLYLVLMDLVMYGMLPRILWKHPSRRTGIGCVLGCGVFSASRAVLVRSSLRSIVCAAMVRYKDSELACSALQLLLAVSYPETNVLPRAGWTPLPQECICCWAPPPNQRAIEVGGFTAFMSINGLVNVYRFVRDHTARYGVALLWNNTRGDLVVQLECA
jgi:hypothetical protein